MIACTTGDHINLTTLPDYSDVKVEGITFGTLTWAFVKLMQVIIFFT